ncbi:hypothetical protein RhiirC2_804313 [Rhizophagus irregularis]|uniref:Uncharacterized protein n=1 Tax=Rhizophagus irregularis TaxID=588596 RepID=A0A2N1L1K3_9GLOM|nr:hypothetical protein RhiirC2_804313 [Rhizophagus irregularis]
MEEFLLIKEPLDIIRISIALFRVLEQVFLENTEQIKKLQSFDTGKKLAKRIRR